MRIDNLGISQLEASITEKPSESAVTSIGTGTGSSSGIGTSFSDVIKNAISEVNNMQSKADLTANKIASGDPVEIHQAMIEMQKAVNSFQLTVQVRNKIIEAYQEIMRMQV